MLTFSPALGSTTTLLVPPVPSHAPARPLVVYFKAAFDSLDLYLKARAEGARVELWTNLPLSGRPAGEWYATAFTELELTQSDDVAVEESGTHEYLLRLRATLQDQVGSRFEFTYRLAYPSGRIQWLGEHGNNGVVVVKQGLAGIDLTGRWDVGIDGAYHIDSSPVVCAVGRVSQVADWAVWAWDAQGVPTRVGDGLAVTSNALILLPRRPNGGTSALESVALVGNKSARLHLSSEGTLSVQSPGVIGRVSLSVLEHSFDLLEEALSAYSGTVASHNSASLAVATRHPNAALPLHLLVLPNSDATPESVSIPLHVLQPLVADIRGKTGLVLFSPETRKLQALRGPLSGDEKALVDGASGGRFVVCPVEVVLVDDKTWAFSLLTSSKSVSCTVDRPEHPLPTPPPSPPARGPSRAGSSPLCAIPAALPQVSAPPNVSQHRRRASLAFIRNFPARLLRAYVHTVFNVVFWFWNVFFRALIARFLGEGLPSRISGILGLALSKTSPQPRTPDQLSKSASEDERRQALSQTRPDRYARSLDTPSNSDFPAPHPKHASRRHQSHPLRAVTHIVLSAILESGSELPFLVLQGDFPKGLHAALDGKALPTPSAARAEDGIFLVEFAGLAAGGRLEVFFDL
ncbi:hypothetical protein K466DRAFT_597520 [Polyporus arcularius HHB13444]|uniref:Uncharacterized protein n=1 Tax=Polyporus arcularius HHB13444 TaxID=1314778 RepID=A0A5C3PIY8_9APHY|nr:hypothetical protein K466DRAFT_597520 [Polyporus arcularius HHB13444]